MPDGAGVHCDKAEADWTALGLQYYGDAIEGQLAVQQVDVPADVALVGLLFAFAREKDAVACPRRRRDRGR